MNDDSKCPFSYCSFDALMITYDNKKNAQIASLGIFIISQYFYIFHLTTIISEPSKLIKHKTKLFTFACYLRRVKESNGSNFFVQLHKHGALSTWYIHRLFPRYCLSRSITFTELYKEMPTFKSSWCCEPVCICWTPVFYPCFGGIYYVRVRGITVHGVTSQMTPVKNFNCRNVHCGLAIKACMKADQLPWN
jgi:hypothetical protein